MRWRSTAKDSWCPACNTSGVDWLPGPADRPLASCSNCHSLERHRVIALIANWLEPFISQGLVVEIAPTPVVRRMLKQRAGRYLGVDLGLDDRQIDLLGDVTRLPLRTGSVDVVVCLHVFEHVPDDAAAMSEVRRVLAETGVAIVNNPWRPDAPTDEDPTAPVEERIRRFGQADHVRWYGTDFEDRLRNAGFDVRRFDVVTELPEAPRRRMNLKQVPIWLLTTGDGGLGGARDRVEELLTQGMQSAVPQP